MTQNKPTVLVVEDDENISQVLTIRLEKEGFEVQRAFDAVLAMDAAKKYAPDLAILDINMPGGDGIEVAQRMRAEPETRGIPVVFLTASKRPDLLDRAREVGAAAVFEKPYDGKDLVAAVRALLGVPRGIE